MTPLLPSQSGSWKYEFILSFDPASAWVQLFVFLMPPIYFTLWLREWAVIMFLTMLNKLVESGNN